MLFLDGGFGLILLALWVFCIVDVIRTEDYRCQNLPKMAWLAIVIFLGDIGSIAWLVAGRPWDRGPANLPYKGNLGHAANAAFPEYDRPGRATGTTEESDEEFLKQVRERAEEQRRRYAEQRKQELAEEDRRIRGEEN